MRHSRWRGVVCAALVSAAGVIVPTHTAHAQAAPDSLRAPLAFPAATPYGSYRPKVKYDKFTDSTRVVMMITTQVASPGGFLGMGKVKPEVSVAVGYSYAGAAPTPPDTVRDVAFLVSSKQMDSDHGDVKAAIQASEKAPIIFLLANGGRERADADLLDSDVDVYGWSMPDVRTSVTYGAVLPIAEYLRIVTSGDALDGRAGDTEFKLDKRALDALRNFAGHMVPASH